MRDKDIQKLMKMCDSDDPQKVIENLGVAIIKITKRVRRSKWCAFIGAALGIAYIVKNEIDKDDLRFQLLEMDKSNRIADKAERSEITDDTEPSFI